MIIFQQLSLICIVLYMLTSNEIYRVKIEKNLRNPSTIEIPTKKKELGPRNDAPVYCEL